MAPPLGSKRNFANSRSGKCDSRPDPIAVCVDLLSYTPAPQGCEPFSGSRAPPDLIPGWLAVRIVAHGLDGRDDELGLTLARPPCADNHWNPVPPGLQLWPFVLNGHPDPISRENHVRRGRRWRSLGSAVGDQVKAAKPLSL